MAWTWTFSVRLLIWIGLKLAQLPAQVKRAGGAAMKMVMLRNNRIRRNAQKHLSGADFFAYSRMAAAR
jgi:hypothetical protein